MKKYVEDNSPEGLELLMGERVTLWCVNYIYTGKLVGVNSQFVKLVDTAVVYETGGLTDPTWKDAQKLPREWYVMVSSIESFGVMK